MLLRLVMVGMVASLGMDLPGGQDMARWSSADECWVGGRAAPCEFLGPLTDDLNRLAEQDCPIAAEALVATVDPDSAFRSVVDEMVLTFASEATPAAIVAVPTFEPMEVGDDLYPGLAYVLNREAEGAPAARPATPETAVEAVAARKVEVVMDETNRGEQLMTAMRLTSQAVQAWARLFREGPVVISARE